MVWISTAPSTNRIRSELRIALEAARFWSADATPSVRRSINWRRGVVSVDAGEQRGHEIAHGYAVWTLRRDEDDAPLELPVGEYRPSLQPDAVCRDGDRVQSGRRIEPFAPCCAVRTPLSRIDCRRPVGRSPLSSTARS